jgi:hypothetical protein
LFEEARDTIVPKLGADHPSTLIVLENLASIYRAFKRTDEAIALGEQVREARVRNLGSYHPSTIRTLHHLAMAYRDDGKPEKSLPLLTQAAAGLEKQKFMHGDAGLVVSHLCESLEKSNQSREADEWRRKWLAAAREKFGPESDAFAVELEEQGRSLAAQRRHADTEPILRECLAIRQKIQPEDWTVFQAQSMLGAALLGQEKYAEAEPLLVAGYEGLEARKEKIPRFYARYRLSEAAERIIRLYEASGQTDKAAQWRSKLKESGAGHAAAPHPKPKS